MIKINTTHPFCVDQPDFTIHAENFDPLKFDIQNPLKLRPLKLNCSAGLDNHTNKTLIEESLSRFSGTINCLDLGCAGAQLILDYDKQNKTDICIGLDGSCGVYRHDNWHYANNKNVLHHADLVKPFLVENEEGSQVKFQIITCWEVIEHFEEKDLDMFFQNVYNHLSEEGIFFGSIALFEDTRDSDGFHQDHLSYKKNDTQYLLHKTVYDNREEWDRILTRYFKVLDYDFEIKLRNHSNSYYFMCQHKRGDTI